MSKRSCRLRRVAAAAAVTLGFWSAAVTAAEPGPIDPATGLRRLPYAVNTQPARYAHTGPTLLRHVRLIDGMGHAPADDRDLLLEDGHVRAIAAGGSLSAPEGALVIDGKGLTALPGLMDLHTHFVSKDRFAGDKSQEPRDYSDVYRYKSYLYGYLYSGVTTILDAGTDPMIGGGIKSLVDEGYVLGPRFFWSGPILEGGIDGAMPGDYRILRTEDIPAIVAWLKHMHVDIIKLYRRTPLSMVERMTSEAHRQGMRVWMDAWERMNTSYYGRFGRLDGWAHINFWFDLTDEDIAEMAKTHQFAVTTFYALNVFSGRVYEEHPHYYDSPLLTNTLAPDFLAGMQAGMPDPLAAMRASVFHRAIANVQDLMGMQGEDEKTVMHNMSKIGGRNVRRMLKAGILVGAGTDGGQGESTLTELELITEDAGVSPLQAIQIATYNSAKILQKEKEFGSLQQGLLGDVLVVEGNPAKNIRDLRNIRYVFKEGKLIDRKSLERQWGY